MTEPHDGERLRKTLLVVIALGISLLFLYMIEEFLMVLFLAAIASGIFHPVYLRLEARLGGRKNLASGATVFLALLVVIAPLGIFLGIVATEAIRLSERAGPWVTDPLSPAAGLNRLFDHYPLLAPLSPYRDTIVTKLGELAGDLGGLVVGAVTAAARETATLFFLLFVMLYAMFFFLMDGKAILRKILYYLPLPAEDENRMVARFLSVSRATIKGTLVIALVQGALGGIAFWLAGLEGPAVLGTVLAVLSTIPGVGPVLVWAPAALYLAATDHAGTALLLAVWFLGVVGTVDSVLRPRLIGKDTKMPDLLILLGTLGGIVLFGPAGFIVGPIVAALFVTAWDLYGETFKDVLPMVDP